MPQKIKMFISNGNISPRMTPNPNVNTANLSTVLTPIPPSPSLVSMIARIHNIKPGCGSCGRK
jgi:hypothetical protein